MDTTREFWLTKAVEHLTPLVAEATGWEPTPVRVSVGWPSTGGLSTKKRVIGQCWSTKSCDDGISQIFISPAITDDAVVVLGTLVHEMLHAWNDCKDAHRAPFARAARACGLEGKPTATVVGDELRERLLGITERLGEFPTAAITPAARIEKTQSTRMLKLQCPGCGYVLRTSRKWLDQGFPACYCGEIFEEA